MKKDIIRVGDLVKIVEPHFVVRVGYPFDLEYAKEHLITREEKKTLNEMFNGISFENGLIGNFGGYHYGKVLNILAHKRLKEHGFGGNERTIHTNHLPDKEGKIFKVVGRKTCVTGHYIQGSTSSYDGEYDPPELRKRKVHLIFEIIPAQNQIYDDWHVILSQLTKYSCVNDNLWIEQKNCVKVCD